MNKYESSPHLVYDCKYHVIFCPKYRRKILNDDVSIKLKEIFTTIANRYSFDIIEMEIMPDHCHLLISCNPRFGIMECIKKLKMISAHNLKKEFPYLKSKVPNIWTRSSFVSTVGSVSLDTVKKYIENQKNV